MNIKLIQADSSAEFDKLCQQAIEEGFMFVGQVCISGLGQGKFRFTQQWAKGIEDEVEPVKPAE